VQVTSAPGDAVQSRPSGRCDRSILYDVSRDTTTTTSCSMDESIRARLGFQAGRPEGNGARKKDAKRPMFKLPLQPSPKSLTASDESPRSNCPAIEVGEDGRAGRQIGRGPTIDDGTEAAAPTADVGWGLIRHGSACRELGWGATCLGFPFHGTFRCSRSQRPPSVARFGTTSRTRPSEPPRPNSTDPRQGFRFGPAAADRDTRPAAVGDSVTPRS
jgi:hypothetical protein